MNLKTYVELMIVDQDDFGNGDAICLACCETVLDPPVSFGQPRVSDLGYSGFALFSHENYPSVKAENPRFFNVGKRIGRLWNELTAEEQVEWKQKANEDLYLFNPSMRGFSTPPIDLNR